MKIVYGLTALTFFTIASFQLFWNDYIEMSYFYSFSALCIALAETVSRRKDLQGDIKILEFKITKLKESSINDNTQRHRL